MSGIITNDDWTEVSIGENEYQYATTSDPRVLAVIERDNEAQISQLYDGDAINPVIYVETRHGLRFEWVAGYDGGEAALMQRAYDEWGWGTDTARRYLWIFHGIAAENADGGYDRDGNWIVACSNAYLEHIGNEPYATYEEARQDCEVLAQELAQALDGYVYGVGYATFPERVTDEEEIEFSDWEVEIACWGFVGETYARSEAAGFEYEEPRLPELLDFRPEAPAEATTGVSGEW